MSILTIAPQTWSVNKMANEFGCSCQLAQKSKELRASKGILGTTIAKSGRELRKDVVRKVIDFYEDDTNSRIMPGKKDVISVKSLEGRCLMQKRLMLMDLKTLYITYKENHADSTVSFSKFAQLRPKHCVLPGASGTHCVCVCTIHKNCELLLDAINIKKLTKDSTNPITDYKDCLQLLVTIPTISVF